MPSTPPPVPRAVLDLLDQGVVLVDATGTVTDANVVACDCCVESPIGRPIEEVSFVGDLDVVVRPRPDGSSVVVVTPEPVERAALRGVLEAIPASVIRIDRDGLIENVSESWLRGTDRRREDVIGARLQDLGFSARVRAELLPLVDGVLMTGRSARLETLLPTAIGLRWMELAFRAQRDGHGNVTHVIGVSNDITLRKNKELSLLREVTTDQLTGLLNRAGLNDELQARAETPGWAGTSLLLIDLDGFKAVNDRHGHLVGDAVLVEVANRLRGAADARTPIARLGGDEFVVLGSAEAGDGPDEVDALARAVLEAFEPPIVTGALTLSIGCSIGVATCSATEDATSLFSRADEAMYRAKRSGAGWAVDGP